MSISESPSCYFTMEDIPCEIVRHIFLCLDREDWKSVLLVCKAWYSLGMRVFVEVLIYKGTRLLQLKNYKRSIKYFDQVLQAVQLVSKREFVEAHPEGRSIFGMLVTGTIPLTDEFVTKQSRVLNNKAVALMNLRKHEEAIECLRDVLKMKPDHVKAMNNLGDNLNSLQKYDEAIEMFNKALDLDPHRLSVLYNKGNSYLHMKRYHEAIEWYDRAIQVSPKDVDSLGNKAIALYRLGCYKEAIRYFEEVLRINPKDRIALRYKEFVAEEMRKKQFQDTAELSQITQERKKELDIQKRPEAIVLAVIGDKKSGKTALTSRIVRGTNLGADQEPEVVDLNRHRCTVEVDGEWCIVDVIDVTAHPESRQFHHDLKKADGFLILYDIIHENSFTEIPKLFKLIKKAKGAKDFPAFLIGNKVDLKSERVISYQQGRAMADELKIGFVEASTTIPINVKFAASSLLQKVIKIKEKERREIFDKQKQDAPDEKPPTNKKEKHHHTPRLSKKASSNCHIS